MVDIPVSTVRRVVDNSVLPNRARVRSVTAKIELDGRNDFSPVWTKHLQSIRLLEVLRTQIKSKVSRVPRSRNGTGGRRQSKHRTLTRGTLLFVLTKFMVDEIVGVEVPGSSVGMVCTSTEFQLRSECPSDGRVSFHPLPSQKIGASQE